MNKILNFLGHKIAPILKKYRSFKVKKQFKLGISKNEDKYNESLLFHHNQICQNFEYRDQSWDSIKNIGQLMWNDLFCIMPFFQKKTSIDSNLPTENSKVVFKQNELICKSSGMRNDWVFLKNGCAIDVPYSIEFHAKIFQENSEFQFAFNYQNIGCRYRFNLKNNKKLSFEVVEKGCFHNDIFQVPFSIPIGEWANFKITVCNDKYIYSVNNRIILSVSKIKNLNINKDMSFAIILWDSDNSNIHTCYKNLKIYKITEG